ncbi:glycosyltransferase [Hippea sp. KM1]|uniref:glycosyltransferase n=1 Tax=Hippea sp. KM1 TaxID=944481 RepID=UPI00046D515E|nr:glycosyltransferase [Hippea sp. KM1]
MRRRISLFIYSLSSGGAERVVSMLLRHLKNKYDITLVLMNSTIFYEIPKDVNIFYLEDSDPNESGFKKFIKLPFLAWKYRNFLRKNKIKISLSFLSRPNYINAMAKLFGGRAKTIITERATPSLQYGYGDLLSVVNKLLLRLYNLADMIISNSKGNAYDLKDIFNIKANIKTIYNFIDSKALKRECNKSKSSSKGFIFITVGRLDKGKNHILLLKAIEGLNAKLWIIGDGELKEFLNDQISKIGLEEKVKLLGRQKNPFEFLKQADCFVFSSNHEGFPNAILEALACGLPVISTDCRSGPREILAPNTDFKMQAKDVELAEYGILVPVNNADRMQKAMELIMKNHDIREKYAQKAKKRAMDFDIEKIMEKWEKVLESA